MGTDGGVPTNGGGGEGNLGPSGPTDQEVSLMSGTTGRNEKGNSLASVDQDDLDRTLLEALA